MKLKNKKTGEIVEICKICPEPFEARDFDCNSLAEFNEEWEDYEEPKESKEYFYIYADGDIYKDVQDDLRKDNGCKEIGNYFETREEAEKAVEKLKAFKRLQELGFRFYGIRFCSIHNYIEWKIKAKRVLTDAEIEEFRECLHKVFGGEDEGKK